jgi:hypothetical protein
VKKFETGLKIEALLPKLVWGEKLAFEPKLGFNRWHTAQKHGVYNSVTVLSK